MGIKLDYDINTVLTTWKATYKQTSAYEGDFDRGERSIYVIAPDRDAAYYWAEDATTSHGDICEVLDVVPVVSDPVQLAYESYTPEGEEYYVLWWVGLACTFKGPFKYEHQAQKHAKGVDKSHNPRVVVHYKENDDE